MGQIVELSDYRKRGQGVAEWQGFYSSAQVSRLAGIPRSTLREWRRRGIVEPSLQEVEDGRVVDEGYSYADLTLIRILRALRTRQLTFESAVKAFHHLKERLGPPSRGWANERVYLHGSHIYAERSDDWGITDATHAGQKVEELLFGDLFDELRELDEGVSILVPKQFRNYVQIDPQIMGGEPVVRNTRIPTGVLAMMLARYGSIDKLAKAYRPVPMQAIEKAIEYENYLDQRLAS